MLELEPDLAFATAYDVIYHEPLAFYAAQLDFLRARFGSPPCRLLDAGCGTGRHLQALGGYAYGLVGLDASRAMLDRARRKLAQAGLRQELVLGDLRRLPLRGSFDGILCLESPLAYMLPDDDLAATLAAFRRVLRHGGLVVADILDYAATLGPDGIAPQTSRFFRDGRAVTVRESHVPDPDAGLWHMRQEFTIGGAETAHGEVHHVLSMRPADEYAAALEDAGFLVEELVDHYAGFPPEVAGEQRMIFVARKHGTWGTRMVKSAAPMA